MSRFQPRQLAPIEGHRPPGEHVTFPEIAWPEPLQEAPAIVAPIEFSMRLADFRALGGHLEHVRSLREVLASGAWHDDGAPQARRWQQIATANPWPLGRPPLIG